MSVISLAATADPTVSLETLRDVAALNNVKIPTEEDEKDYLHFLNSLDAVVNQIRDLPAYDDPRLMPDPHTTMSREYWKPESNPLNAWSHRCNTTSSSPTTNTLCNRTIAFKDNISVGGLPLTAGTFPKLLSANPTYPISTIDAPIVSRVLQAGGTVLGTATCEHFSMSPLSHSSATGPVHNPWLKGYTTGGSSSGCAALLGISQVKKWRERHGKQPDDSLGEGVSLAVGGDQGGSIRVPCAYAGIYGLKPTHGLIPYTGILSLHPLVDHCGPMATSISDLSMLLSVLAGYDGIDPRMTAESPLRQHVKDYSVLLNQWISVKEKKGEWEVGKAGMGLRIGVVDEAFEVLGLSSEVKSAVMKAVQQFKDVGATVSNVSIPMHTLGPAIWTVASRAGLATYGLQNTPPPLLSYPLTKYVPQPFNQETYLLLNHHNPAIVNVAFNATFLAKHHDLPSLTAKAHMHVHQLRAAYDAGLEQYDVLITPVNPGVGSKHPEEGSSVSAKMEKKIGATLNTCQFNVTGHPALSMPVGWGNLEDGGGKLPVAMQIVGKRWDEETILKVAAAWEVGGIGLDKWDGQ